MRSVDSLPGTLVQRDDYVVKDTAQVGTFYTTGATVNNPLSPPGTLVQQWAILGFSAQIKITLVTGGLTGSTVWGKLGKLWLGISRNSPIRGRILVPTLPDDLSAYTVAWDGETDPIRISSNFDTTNPNQVAAVIPVSFMLPQPLIAHANDQLGFSAILLPSLIGTTGPSPTSLYVWRLSYNVLYTREFVK